MSISVEPLQGSARFVVLTEDPRVVRGAPVEYRHRGIAVVIRQDVVSALTEVVRDADSILIVSSSVAPENLAPILELAREVCASPVVLGLDPLTDAETVRSAFALGVQTSVALPLTPDRLERLLRASPRAAVPIECVQAGDLMVDPGRHVVEWQGSRIDVTPREFDVLLCLARAHPYMVTLDDLARQHFEAVADPHASVRVLIKRIRARLGESAEPPIETVRGLGYRLAG